MEKKEILEILKEMIADYESALIFNGVIKEFEQFLNAKKLEYGFCEWICKHIQFGWKYPIMDEIKKDFKGILRNDDFFYPTTLDFNGMERIKKYCLFPRAQHLKSTIERLEKEIIENIKVTMPQQI